MFRSMRAGLLRSAAAAGLWLGASAVFGLAPGLSGAQAQSVTVGGNIYSTNPFQSPDWNAGNTLKIGETAPGTMTVEGGGKVSNGVGAIGDESGAIGKVTVKGEDSVWSNTSYLIVGYEGDGSLVIEDGGRVENTASVVAWYEESESKVKVSGAGSIWDNSANLVVGDAGDGSLTIENGGRVENTYSLVAVSAESEGKVKVSGAGSVWANSSAVEIGRAGDGSLTIENGGRVENTYSLVAVSAESESTVKVSGAGSVWDNSGVLEVARAGKGSVLVEEGGRVESEAAFIGELDGSIGEVRVTGAGSILDTAQGLDTAHGMQIGIQGRGALLVESKGRVESSRALLGRDAGGIGSVQVIGEDSVWVNSGVLRIGVQGTGWLSVAQGGLVKADGNITVAEGASGTISVDSASTLEGGAGFSQGSLGAYVVGIDAGNDRAGLVKITGSAALAVGAKLDVVLEGTGAFAAGDSFKVLDAGSLSGTYELVDGGQVSAFIKLKDVYDVPNGDVYVVVDTLRDLSDAALTPNQVAAARGAQSSAAIAGLFQALGSDAEAQDAFDQASGEAHASIKTMLIGDSGFLRDAVTNRLRAVSATSDATAMAARLDGTTITPAADPAVARKPYGFWLSGFGAWGEWDGDGNAAALDRSLGGVFAGADAGLGDWRIGVLGGYSNSSLDVDDRTSSGSVDGYYIGLYAGTQWDAIALRTGASYGWNDIETRRRITNPVAETLKADYGAGVAQVFGEVAYVADLGGLLLEPFANIAYVKLQTEGFEEEGGLLALDSASDSTDTVLTTLGLRPEARFSLGEMEARFAGLIGWRHAFGDITPESTFAFAGGDDFGIRGVPLARDTAVIEAGLDLALSDSAVLGVSYQGQFGDGVSDNGVTAKLGIAF